jgi:hypothetical protein
MKRSTPLRTQLRVDIARYYATALRLTQSASAKFARLSSRPKTLDAWNVVMPIRQNMLL